MLIVLVSDNTPHRHPKWVMPCVALPLGIAAGAAIFLLMPMVFFTLPSRIVE
jgi:hypothetical protein